MIVGAGSELLVLLIIIIIIIIIIIYVTFEHLISIVREIITRKI